MGDAAPLAARLGDPPVRGSSRPPQPRRRGHAGRRRVGERGLRGDLEEAEPRHPRSTRQGAVHHHRPQRPRYLLCGRRAGRYVRQPRRRRALGAERLGLGRPTRCHGVQPRRGGGAIPPERGAGPQDAGHDLRDAPRGLHPAQRRQRRELGAAGQRVRPRHPRARRRPAEHRPHLPGDRRRRRAQGNLDGTRALHEQGQGRIVDACRHELRSGLLLAAGHAPHATRGAVLGDGQGQPEQVGRARGRGGLGGREDDGRRRALGAVGEWDRGDQ